MAELTFFYGPMDCGKSTLALQIHHNATRAGKRVLLLTEHDREGAVISSRLGLRQPAVTVGPDVDLYELVTGRIARGEPVDEIVCDEAQFFTRDQIDQLARVVDELEIDVRAFGLLTDFTTRLFEGSQRLLELADRRNELQVEARCWCGARATHTARTVRGAIVREGAQVVVGDVDDAEVGDARLFDVDDVAYEVLCRRHHREGATRGVAAAGGGADRVLASEPQEPYAYSRS